MSRVSAHLVLGTILTAFGSSMLFGYNVAVFNLPEKNVKKYLISRSPNATEEAATALYSFATSMYLIGGAIGAFSSGFVADRLGRRNGLIANNLMMVFGAGLFLISFFSSVPELVYVARIIVGVSSGMTQSLASMYLTEIAPIKLRGFIGAFNEFAIVVGHILSNLLTFENILGGNEYWLIASGLVGLPALIEAIFHWLLPESPRYLYLLGRYEDAKVAQQKYDPKRNTEDFLAEMNEEGQRTKELPKFRFYQIFSSAYTRPMLIACLLQMQQEFSGIPVIDAYSTIIMESSGVAKHAIEYCALGVNVFALICNMVSLPILEYGGRRRLLLSTTLCLAVCLGGMGATVELKNRLLTAEASIKIASIIAVILIFLHSAFFTMGIGNVGPLIVSEIFRQEQRGAAYSVSQGVQWISNIVITFAYPNVEKYLNGIIFFIFMAVVMAVWILCFVMMPETKGRTVDDICKSLDHPVYWNCSKQRKTRKTSFNQEETHPLTQKVNNENATNKVTENQTV